jgi:hypothetical protein
MPRELAPIRIPLLDVGLLEDHPVFCKKRAYAEELATWDKNENLANYMLSMKLPDAIYIRLMNASLVAEAWVELLRKIVKKLLRMKSDLRSELMNTGYGLGADLPEQLMGFV